MAFDVVRKSCLEALSDKGCVGLPAMSRRLVFDLLVSSSPRRLFSSIQGMKDFKEEDVGSGIWDLVCKYWLRSKRPCDTNRN